MISRELTLEEKVVLMYELCEWRMLEALQAQKLDLDAPSMRVEPLGRDRHGSTYWYFSGLRLYREGVLPLMHCKHMDQ